MGRPPMALGSPSKGKAQKGDLTPAMKQYLEIKARYPDCILLFRMGDFYEMFFEDALLASQILEIALTTRDKGKEDPIPMCGVPYRAVAPYIAKLLEHGHKVAICEQVEDPRQAKGIVKREVVRVITPGMVVEEENLPEGGNNYLLSLYPKGGRIALAFFDLSTGEFRGCVLEEKGLLWAELRRNVPREALLPEGEERWRKAIQEALGGILVNVLPEDDFSVLSDPLLPEDLPEVLRAAGAAVLRYVRSTQKLDPAHVHPLTPYEVEHYLVLDETTQRNLELFESPRGGTSLFQILDRTVTSMGRRKLRHWLSYPLRDLVDIRRRQEAIEELKDRPFERGTLREVLKGLVDVERLSARLALGRATPRDLAALRELLERLPQLRGELEAFQAPLLREIALQIQPPQGVAELLQKALVEDPPAVSTEGGIIRDGFHPELDELRSISREGKGWIARLEARERQRTGIQSLKVGYNQVFGYYIEVTKPNLHLVPPDYIRKQTLTGAERFITPELKEYENKVLGAEERIRNLEYQLFCELREAVASRIRELQEVAAGIAQLDCLAALAEVAARNHYVRPVVDEGDEIDIVEGRHPVIEQTSPEPFVPNDAHLDAEGHQVLIITGPNMAGKSTYIRQVALLVIMAQMGSFVPAKEAKMGVVDRIFTRVGASDDISRGESTFMVEMKETATILKEATPRSLVILDEIGRGTSTYDGLSIAWAVAEHLHDVNRSKTLFATHYHELTELSSSRPRVKNFHIAVKEYRGEVVFLRELRPGGISRSYGIQVAKLAGLPEGVIQRAKEVLLELEKRTRDEGGRPGFARGRKGEHLQLDLFAPKPSKVLEELKGLDPDRLTPLEALQIIYRWKEMEG